MTTTDAQREEFAASYMAFVKANPSGIDIDIVTHYSKLDQYHRGDLGPFRLVMELLGHNQSGRPIYYGYYYLPDSDGDETRYGEIYADTMAVVKMRVIAQVKDVLRDWADNATFEEMK